jgi:hypothetical protein
VNDYLNEQLRTTDPVAHEPGLSLTEVQAMRRAIVAAATDTHHAGWAPWRLRPAALTAALACALALGVFIGTRFDLPGEKSTPPKANEQRQLQFETPGGTRVVWVLNSKFDLPKDR